MATLLPIDLPSCLTAAVSEEGRSRRGAADRFGVSTTSAVRRVDTVNMTGSFEAESQGGDTHTHRIEAFSGAILAAVTAWKDVSLADLTQMLGTDHGVSFGASTVWCCLDGHHTTFKNTAARSRAGAA